VVKVLVQTDRFLPTILADLLFKIAMPVQQCDSIKIQVEIAGRLAMITRKNS